jgi:hypothetical protein
MNTKNIHRGNRFWWQPFLSRLSQAAAFSQASCLASLETKHRILNKLKARMKQEKYSCS